METPVSHPSILSWASALAGLALSLVTFAALIALFAAFGGIAISDATSFSKVSTFTAVALVLSTFLAAGAGGYFSGRLYRTKVDLAGIAQGTLVGSLFLLLVLCQGASAVGSLAKATGAAIGGIAAGSGALVTDPMVQDIVEDSLGDLKLRSEPSVVVKGVASRLLRGDQEAARNYLAAQASLTPEQADQKIQFAKAKADQALAQAREAAATALKAAGWTTFLLIVLGLSAGAMGGLLATKCNERYFLDTSDEEVQRIRVLHPKV